MTQPNLMHKLPSPEEVLLDVPYTFTFNPSNAYQRWNHEDRLKLMQNWMILVFSVIPAKIKGKIEISRMGRIHFHGTITFPSTTPHTGCSAYENVSNFYVDHVGNLTDKGAVEIDTIADPKVWDEYCCKSQHICNLEVNTNPLNVNRIKQSAKISIKQKKLVDDYN